MWLLKLIPFIGNLFSTVNNLTDKINAAQTPDELAGLMREAGLGQ